MPFRLRGLTLTKIFNTTEHVLCNGFLVFNNFLHDDRLGESLLDPLGHDGLGSTVKQFLLAITERMGLNVTSCLGNARICLPVVVTCSLLSRAEVAVRSLVHFGSFIFFFHCSACWVENILCRHTDSGRYAKRVLVAPLLDLIRPLINSLVALSERLSNG